MVKEKIDQYLEFDSQELFIDPLVRIFGGAVRDSIAEDEIRDVDILVGASTLPHLESVLEKHGYAFLESQYPKDLASVYTNLQVISEPKTWIKGTKVVQLIRARLSHKLANSGSKIITRGAYTQAFHNLINNVDISCCGVSFDGKNIYENFSNAVLNCLTKTFSVNHGSAMYSEERIMHRKVKLQKRGWKEVYSLQDIRDLKIESIFDIKELNYIAYESVS